MFSERVESAFKEVLLQQLQEDYFEGYFTLVSGNSD